MSQELSTAHPSENDESGQCPICGAPFVETELFVRANFDGEVCIEPGPVRRYGAAEMHVPQVYIHDAEVEKYD